MSVAQDRFTLSLMDAGVTVPPGLSNPDGSPATKRFDVYRNNVAVSLTEALIATFPVTYKLVGDEFFRGMAGVYLRKHRPDTPLIQRYGDRMPTFLRGFRPASAVPYLSDITKLELALRDSYHAADHTPIDAVTLAEMAPDQLMQARIRLAPSTGVVISKFPIYGIHAANTRDDAPAPVQRPENVLITRPGFDPEQTRVSLSAAKCVTALLDGAPLGAAMTRAGDDLDLGKLLGLLLGTGAITDIS